jgi:methylmalonyl-CoA mutase cobalamin-binding subunit
MNKSNSYAGIKELAEYLARQGQGGDTMLAHINPEEAAFLKAMGGTGAINPHTGLHEFVNAFDFGVRMR